MAKKQETPKKQEHSSTASREACAACAQKDAQIGDLTETLKRVAAEFENYQKRSAKENDTFRAYAVEKFLCKLLPVLDSFDAAIKHQANGNGKKNADPQDGLLMIYSQLLKILDAEGVKRIDTLGKKYQHETMEVLLTQPSDTPDIVLEELQAGYSLGGRVIRSAKVKIGVAHDENPSPQNNDPNTT